MTCICNKENVDPLGWRRIRPSRSPLPDWYPRWPLQDITSVLNQFEKNERSSGNAKKSAECPPRSDTTAKFLDVRVGGRQEAGKSGVLMQELKNGVLLKDSRITKQTAAAKNRRPVRVLGLR